MAKKKLVTQIKDITPVIQEVSPGTNAPPAMPASTVIPISNPTLNYHSSKFTGRGHFLQQEYNLAEVGRIEDTDSYVRQAFAKKVALMLKEGWDIVGSNPKTVRYVRQRLLQIAQASKMPTIQLLRDIGAGLTRKSNVFLLKVRNIDSSGGRIRETPEGAELKPVAAYFLIPAETMEFQLSGNTIIKWRQRMPDGTYKEYNPRDVVHIYFDRKEGFVFGTPTIIPVIDDIRALRKIEENIELLVYQHLFPIFQWKVGTDLQPAGMTPSGEDEVDVIKREIQFMPSEGGIVTTNRHEITAIGAEGRALKAESYVQHFKNRVISGLGMSAVDYGEGDTANRATADNMSRNLIDSVKDFQQVIEIFFNEFVIKELLLESTFGEMVLETENCVWLKFKEIDIDAQIKRETHAADQFTKNMLSHDEARVKMGLEPMAIPTEDEAASDEDLSLKYPAFHKTQWKMFKEPELLIMASDEPYTATAMAAATNPSTATSVAQNEEAGQKKIEHEKDLAVAKEKAKPRPIVKNSLQDSVLSDTYSDLQSQMITYVQLKQSVDVIDHDWIGQVIRSGIEKAIPGLQSQALLSFRNGYSKYSNTRDVNFINSMKFARGNINGRINKYVDKLIRDTVSSIRRNVKDSPEVGLQTHSVFDVLKFRAQFIEDVEIRKAYTYGVALGMRDAGYIEAYSQVKNTECDSCGSAPDTINIMSIVIDDLPPYHANCSCTISHEKRRPQPKPLEIQNSLEPVTGIEGGEDTEAAMLKAGTIGKCPTCESITVTRMGTTGYYCRKCSKTFDVDDNQYQFLACVMKARAQLYQRHPDWTENQIMVEAESACLSKLIDKLQSDSLEDADKLELLKLKTRLSIRKRHPEWNQEKIRELANFIATNKFKGSDN